MSHDQDLRAAIEGLREREFSDLPAALVGEILDIEFANVDERAVAVDKVTNVIHARALELAEAESPDTPAEAS